jgi:hypothetical protein
MGCAATLAKALLPSGSWPELLQLLAAAASSAAREARELGQLLDTLCAGGEGGVCKLPSKLQAVHPLANPSAASVLYLDCGNTLVIQSQPYCVAWKKMREGAYRKI